MRGSRTGSSTAPAIAVAATVVLSVVLFFAFTLPGTKTEAEGQAQADESSDTDLPPEVAAPDPPAPEPPEPEPEPQPPAVADFTTSPDALIGEITKRLSSGDLDSVRELLGESDLSDNALAAVFGSSGYEPVPGEAPTEIGLFGDVTRWAVPMRKRAAAAAPPNPDPGALQPAPREDPGAALEPQPALTDPIPGSSGQEGPAGIEGDAGADGEGVVERIYLDLKKGVGADGKVKWSVAKVHFPPALQDRINAADPLAAQARSELDAMVVADTFITAVAGKDFASALRMVAKGQVPEEKIAGLCIVFEEGQLSLRQARPLVATALGNDKAWVIAHVESPKLGEGTEFGLVMGRPPNGEGWEITEINFGKLIDSYVAASEAGRVPYTPIKSKPGSGELLVLYFEYDEITLLPRAKRQLEILAGILKADPGKTLTIAGHADALGSEDYNARLSATRAASVKEQLIAFGVPEPQILTRGFGEAKPWKPNERPDGTDDPTGRAYNRRAELYLDF